MHSADPKTDAELSHAKALIQSKRYIEAYKFLEGVNHPMAATWRSKLKGMGVIESKSRGRRWKIALLIALVVIGVFAALAVAENGRIFGNLQQTQDALLEGFNR